MILKILNDKHPTLRKVCSWVVKPSDFNSFAMSMMTTMKAHKALGLAANQVGKTLRIITIDTPDFSGIMFNPEILSKSEEPINFPEGCLSIKGKTVITTRSKKIEVRWQDSKGLYNQKEYEDLTAVVIQHEVDHLSGLLMTDLEK
ncbi:Def N-formylmethionyl-tRNA deformylase [uncultured Caudovirales phage]|uniref:Def N-formylmethionyl-tRNA deformylase n=1 Tax=uncultured Caudovirales phage TaxID=2100421 RepID=A0A6J5KQB3_9CAUD|nr:Def N-formylmethionyl-tRNA deformylase [uncultured Caudovirales phage]